MSMPPITDLNDYRRQREQESRVVPVRYLRWPDPTNPNRNYYFLVHENCNAVQGFIDSLRAEVESFGNGNGKAEFTKPRCMYGLYCAEGMVEVQPDIITEFYK